MMSESDVPSTSENASRPLGARIAWQQFVLVAVLAVCVRGGVLLAGWERLRDDPDGYRQLAGSLLEHGTFGYRVEQDGQIRVVPTAYRPPLYPIVLAALGFPDGAGPRSVALLHWVLGVATVLLVYAVAIVPFGGRVASTAAVLVTFDPILLNQSVLVMTETIAALLAVGVWWLLSRSSRVSDRCLAGLLMGLAALCRPVFLVWLILSAVALLATSVKSHRWRGALGFCVVAVVVLAPWVARNAWQFQRPILTTTHGGYTIWLGNNDDYYAFLATAPRGSIWDSADLDARYARVRADLGDDIAADRWASQQAIECIRRQPGAFVGASIARVARLWGLVPNRLSPDESVLRRTARWAVGLWYLVVSLLALFTAFCLKQRLLQSPWLWMVLLGISLTAVHSVYWTDLRMRAPMIPMLCVASAWGAIRLRERWLIDKCGLL